jgi:DNA-binding CsgD family transcriptional regulator
MATGLNIVIVSPNQIQAIGLKTILTEYFSPGEIDIIKGFENTLIKHQADFIFLPSDIYLAHHNKLKVICNKLVILTEFMHDEESFESPAMLNITLSQTELVDQLESIFKKNAQRKEEEDNSKLSSREIEVLVLVARGFINKQIADKLTISLHTVMSHRKNITHKLGIKTVSGLTMYALLNGLIQPRDVN